MNTLRAKIAALLVISIVSVVVLITLSLMYTFRGSDDVVVDMLVRQLILMERLARQNPEAGVLSPNPDTGAPDEDQTELMRATATRLGTPLDIIVTHKEGDSPFQTASVRVGDRGWLVVDIDPPPSNLIFAGWLALITVAVGSIAVLAAYRMSKPLAPLESAVESVSPDGVLPALAERGPAEVRATAAAIN